MDDGAKRNRPYTTGESFATDHVSQRVLGKFFHRVGEAVAMALAFKTLEGTNDIMVTFSFWIFGSLVICTLWKSRTGLREIDKTVHRVIFITWESSILPSISMIISAGLYHAAPQRSDHLVLFFVLLTGKFYTFGMLRTLNARIRLRERMKSHDLGRTSLSGWQWDASSTQVERQSSLLSIPKPPQLFDRVRPIEPPVRSSEASSINALEVPFVSTLEIYNALDSEARSSSYFRQRSKLPTGANRILFVKNLSYSITGEDLYDLFGRYGSIRQIRIGNDAKTKGTAFVVYEDVMDAKNALDHLNGFHLLERYIVVLYHMPAKQDAAAAKADLARREEELAQLKKKHDIGDA
ncbi:hypothetical protein D9619_000492 [Psilocybe cf. subviscida]|uniref:RRM domain-containing protein n=1 Tax=Psilocybe cf. subviscida TaxID=2480587 RepID=A0A8H5BFI7_9AGAR|nr:hypothetical protein D9619_000492 [Psilocybe cf. subviscida]